ncbi:flagellar hook assembly protein FlgD [Acidovorax sp. GBBC 3334]|uniref:flagellar hook assembly protein FlgD n=1 Tax=Acidovorax sp. GBBC 3334 TaxID=2940496 RepID=UPI002303C7C7|nr:flagellar hook capping FlgD N-terminal domain-containing protein [Acidovorax sp. GBBC 3334]MDA8455940.1 flagellar hook assembly protein FlgD [Acidovorax sp. GBBC 3334]
MILNPIGSTATVNTGSNSNSSTDPAAAQDRFLKLLVAQLNNQDPMNPLDNAQMTSQMAQINTVTGIQQLNLSMQTMAEQFTTMQTLQGTMMIGRSVLTEGAKMTFKDGTGTGTFDLKTAATDVKVEVVTPGGQLVDTVEVGASESGRHTFSWDGSKYTGTQSDLKFRVVATNKDVAVEATPLMQAKVLGTGSNAGALTLNLDTGTTVNYSNIRAVL